MVRQPSRQIHLDFHTSEHIPGVGSRFNKENFKKALLLGRVQSINVFAKCHHGWCYFPAKNGKMHPTLNFDLTGAMMEAAHEIGVRAPLYITVGWSANDAKEHPEWIVRHKDGTPALSAGKLDAKPEESKPYFSWYFLCPNGGYDQMIYALTREICERYDHLDGLWYDINFMPNTGCWCEACVKGMKQEGLDPDNTDDALFYYRKKWKTFMSTCCNILKERHKEATVFFNGGGAEPYTPEWHPWQTHFEMEDLPTTWGGYDKLPARAKFFAWYGKDYLGMSGKFHTSWGEFGGFKTSEAIKYECAVMLSFGARCSFGDQMHPTGEMDLETYRLIGEAYKYVEQVEPWCFDTKNTSRLGIMYSKNRSSDNGLVKMLLEKQLDFDVVHDNEELHRFDVILLPDSVLLDEASAKRLNSFVEKGGGLLLSGKSGLNRAMDRFMIDAGVQYLGPANYENDYLRVSEKLGNNMVSSPILCKWGAHRTAVVDGERLASICEPYFNRTYEKYCSHMNTPPRPEPAEHPAAVIKGKTVYLAHEIFRMYNEYGSLYHREYFMNALNLIYTDPVLKVEMPSAGRVNFVKQPNEDRYVLHLLYASPIQRGTALVIEDIVPLYNVKVALKVEEKIKRVYLAPQMENIEFRQEGQYVNLAVPKVHGHQIVVLDIEG